MKLLTLHRSVITLDQADGCSDSLRPLADEKGASLVEFAIASSVLMLLLGGIFDLGLALHNYTLLQHTTDAAVHAIAARYNLHRSCSEIRWYLDTISTPYLRDALGADVHGGPVWTVTWEEEGSGNNGGFAVLKINGSFSSGCYFLCTLTPNAFKVSASSEIAVENVKGAGC